MRAENYPPINVLNTFRGFPNKELPYHITPYRFQKQNGEVVNISEVRHFHRDRKGKGHQFHYVVATEDNRYFRLLFDTNTFTWRLVEEKSDQLREC